MTGKRLLLMSAAAVANLAVLLAPCAALGWPQPHVVWSVVVFLLLATVGCLVDCCTSADTVLTPRAKSDQRHARLALATGIMLLLAYWSSQCEALLRSSAPPLALSWLGTLAMLAGACLRGLAIHSLRSQFRTGIVVRGGARLIESGVYGWLRHPSEAGLLLIAVGAAALLGSVVGLALTLGGLVPLVLWRLSLEEAELKAAWGPRYDNYRRRVPALLPRFTRRLCPAG